MLVECIKRGSNRRSWWGVTWLCGKLCTIQPVALICRPWSYVSHRTRNLVKKWPYLAKSPSGVLKPWQDILWYASNAVKSSILLGHNLDLSKTVYNAENVIGEHRHPITRCPNPTRRTLMVGFMLISHGSRRPRFGLIGADMNTLSLRVAVRCLILKIFTRNVLWDHKTLLTRRGNSPKQGGGSEVRVATTDSLSHVVLYTPTNKKYNVVTTETTSGLGKFRELPLRETTCYGDPYNKSLP